MSLELAPSGRPFVAVSDVHLFPGGKPHPGRESFLSFLGELAQAGPGELWIAGDLFDFWHEKHGAPRGFERILSALAAVSEAGWSLTFLPGNHDGWVGGAFSAATGARVLGRGPVEAEVEGRRVLLAHGDGLGGGDWGYRLFLGPILRSRAAGILFRALPVAVGETLAGLMSGTSRRILRRQSDCIPAHLSAWADGMLRSGIDIVVTGHTHVAGTRLSGRGIHISLGDWLGDFHYASSDPSLGLRLVRYEAPGPASAGPLVDPGAAG
ncbi:UDP-2,3-diacylglucosamine diphosphatase [Candidatus Fermentibacteria bacterium]|nr:UDP-2,3-diacylglucosamine diphosphatase [Candidatus Fermentibacteria bacterium]